MGLYQCLQGPLLGTHVSTAHRRATDFFNNQPALNQVPPSLPLWVRMLRRSADWVFYLCFCVDRQSTTQSLLALVRPYKAAQIVS